MNNLTAAKGLGVGFPLHPAMMLPIKAANPNCSLLRNSMHLELGTAYAAYIVCGNLPHFLPLLLCHLLTFYFHG
ncbi:hypothetical protein ES708_29172 [subsurface metagenome]